jgi:type IV pilus assembly protein PilZ
MMPPRAGGILNLVIPDLPTLFSSYMPYVLGGGLFVSSTRPAALGQEVFVVVTLPGSSERYPVTGKVVWYHHRNQGMRPAGFGVQLTGDEGTRLRNEIEKMLAGQAGADRQTFTM